MDAAANDLRGAQDIVTTDRDRGRDQHARIVPRGPGAFCGAIVTKSAHSATLTKKSVSDTGFRPAARPAGSAPIIRSMEEEAPLRPPVRLVVSDELGRSRLTVFFRLLLFIPHLLWLLLWGLAASVVAFVLWIAILASGRPPRELHAFVSSYVRYTVHVAAWFNLAANPYPGFTGAPGYPVDVEIDPPAPQRRLTVGFRLVLALPVLLLAGVLSSGSFVGAPGGLLTTVAIGGGVASAAAFLAWFACLVRGRMPPGLQDLTAYCVGYGAQVTAYLLLVTDRYPSTRPDLVEPLPALPEHPVRIAVREGTRRSRLTVFFRLLLSLPHFVWLTLWSVPAFLAAIAAWFAALAVARVPLPLHRFLAAYVRYASHVFAFAFLVGGPFPGFAGTQGSYPIDVEIDPPVRQRRLVTLFRLFLAIPALILASTLGTALYVVAFLGWWAALATGRMPRGLRDLGAAAIRYDAQTYAYLLLLTARYPYSSPVITGRRPDAETDSPELPEPQAAPA